MGKWCGDTRLIGETPDMNYEEAVRTNGLCVRRNWSGTASGSAPPILPRQASKQAEINHERPVGYIPS